MFEVGFSEIVLILGLALLVLGPEKLPGLAEKVGRWTGRARSMARQLRTQLEQEVNIEEMTKARSSYTPPPPPPMTPNENNTPPPYGAEPPVETAAAEPTEPPIAPVANDQPHNPSGLDLQTMVSGMEPPPQSAAETPANKAVQ
jgi:sec-independent protein translocase protein TatB